MIAFLCHPYHRGGVTRWMADMAIAYAQRGEKVFFITVEPVKPFYSSGGKETIITLLGHNSGITIVSTKVGWPFEFGTQTYRASIYAKLLSENVPEGTAVILSDDFAAWETSELLKGQYKLVGVLHADDKVYYNLATRYKNSIDVFTCVSARVKQKLLTLGDYAEDRVFVIPCGIELPALERQPKHWDGIRLVYIGRITEYQKRVSDLVKVAGKLKEEKINFSLTVIGDGSEREKFEQDIDESGVSGNVQLLGWQAKEKIFEILYRSDLVLLTSAFEGMPIAVMEGLSAGCGVISTRVSGVEDYEFNTFAGSCMWLNEIGNITQVLDNIKKAVQVDEDKRVAAAKKLAHSEFGMDVCMNRYDHAINGTNCVITTNNKKTNGAWIGIKSLPVALARVIKIKYTR